MNEPAIETRNMAKVGIFNIKASFSTNKEFEAFMMRNLNNDKLFEKVRTVLEKGDFESINNGSTRYGTSMRGSSLDARSAGQTRSTVGAGVGTGGLKKQ